MNELLFFFAKLELAFANLPKKKNVQSQITKYFVEKQNPKKCLPTFYIEPDDLIIKKNFKFVYPNQKKKLA